MIYGYSCSISCLRCKLCAAVKTSSTFNAREISSSSGFANLASFFWSLNAENRSFRLTGGGSKDFYMGWTGSIGAFISLCYLILDKGCKSRKRDCLLKEVGREAKFYSKFLIVSSNLACSKVWEMLFKFGFDKSS